MTRRFHMAWITMTLMLVWGGFFNHAALAQDVPSDIIYTGIDTILLVDQSGSMGGRAYGSARSGPPGDPNDLRFQTQQYVMKWLSDYSFYGSPEGSTNRMSVIGFGDPQRTVVLDWVELADGATDEATRLQQEQDLEYLLSSDRFGFRNFEYTNFEAAVQWAQRQFDQLPPLPDGQSNLRAVIIITDGEPCAVADTDANGNCTNTSANINQLTRLGTFVNTNFGSDSYEFYLLPIENPAQPYWSNYAATWTSIISDPNRIKLTTDADQMAVNVNDMMTAIQQRVSSSRISFAVGLDANGNGSIELPPYVALATLSVFKSGANPTANVSLTMPDGTVANAGMATITVDNTQSNIERWRIIAPQPGTWRISTDPSVSVQARFSQDLLQVKQDTSTPVYQFQSLPLSPFLYYKSDGTSSEIPVAILPSPYELAAEAYVTDPNSLMTTVPLTSNSLGGVNPQFTGEYPVTETGDYTVEYRAYTPNYQDPLNAAVNWTPLDTRGSAVDFTFTVDPVVITFNIPNPRLNAMSNWIESLPYTACVQIQDAATRSTLDGTTFDPLRVEVEAAQVGGGTTSFNLAASTADPNCTFTGEIMPPAPGDYELNVRGYATVNGVESEVFNNFGISPQYAKVDPITRITLEVVEPTTNPADSPTRDTMPLWNQEPLDFTVIARGDDDTEYDLAVISGNPDPLTLNVIDNNGNDLSADFALSKSGNYTYTLSTTDLNNGAYAFTVTGAPLDPAACECNYALAADGVNLNNSVQQTVNRFFPLSIYAQWGAIAIVLALFLLLGVAYGIYLDNISQNPLKGYMEVVVKNIDDPYPDGDEVASLTFNGRYNRQTFKGAELGALATSLQIQSLYATNNGKNSGRIQVKIKHKGARQPITMALPKESEQLIAELSQDEDSYYIIYMPMATGDFDTTLFGDTGEATQVGGLY